MFPEPRQEALDRITLDTEAIAGITAPTLIVHGRDDLVIPVSNAWDLVQLIDDAELHVFGRCGHWTQIEYADAFSSLVLDFLRRRQ